MSSFSKSRLLYYWLVFVYLVVICTFSDYWIVGEPILGWSNKKWLFLEAEWASKDYPLNLLLLLVVIVPLKYLVSLQIYLLLETWLHICTRLSPMNLFFIIGFLFLTKQRKMKSFVSWLENLHSYDWKI